MSNTIADQKPEVDQQRLVRQAFNQALVEKFREGLLLQERRDTYDAMTDDQKMVVLHALNFNSESFKPNAQGHRPDDDNT